MEYATIQLIVSIAFIASGVLFVSITTMALMLRKKPISPSSVVFLFAISALPIVEGVWVLTI